MNEELILAYKTIREDVNGLINVLVKLQNEYFLLAPGEQKEFFYKTCSEFNINRKKIDFQKFQSDWLERAAQIIFLNRTCFNGLFRVNSKAEFNVPFGDYKNPKICDAENLRAVSNILKNTEIECGNFDLFRNVINEKTFVYFDPPYRPISKTASFTSYSKNDFDDKDQICLANFYGEIDEVGAKLMLSNSDPQNTDPEDVFFEELYEDVFIGKAIATRAINSNGKKRGEIYELVITNYEGHKMKSSPVFEGILGCTTPDEVFEYLTNNLNESITYWDYFVNWEKVRGNVRKWEIDLNTLNHLVGKDNIEEEFKYLAKERPSITQLIPVLLASGENSCKILTDYVSGSLRYEDFDFRPNMLISDDEVNKAYRFVTETGLSEIFHSKLIKNVQIMSLVY